MKRIISMFLCLVLLLGTFSAAAVAAVSEVVGHRRREVALALQLVGGRAERVGALHLYDVAMLLQVLFHFVVFVLI